MFARVRISLPTEEGNILVPERALTELQGKNFVWVVSADNKASQRSVEVAPIRVGSDVIILEGLDAGERVVVEGVQKLREGAPVQAMAQRRRLPPAPNRRKPAPPSKAKPSPRRNNRHG